MSTLLVIYMSLATGDVSTQSYNVPSPICHAKSQQIRRNVKAGRVWVFCQKESS